MMQHIFSKEKYKTFENVCCKMQHVNSNNLKCIPSHGLSPLCMLFLSCNFDSRRSVSIVKSTPVSCQKLHIHPSVVSSEGLKIIPIKANDLIYQAAKVAMKYILETFRAGFKNKASIGRTYDHFSEAIFKSESMRAPGRAATCHLANFHEILPV